MRYGCKQARQLLRSLDRRQLLQVGTLGALGLTLSDLLATHSASASSPDNPKSKIQNPKSADACILLWLTGGPSQFDTFDPKPDAPAEVRGPFKPIATSVPGIQFTEVFPQTAKQARHLAVLRSVYHNLDHHVLAQGWMTAGRLHDAVSYPPMGSVVARLKGSEPLLPAFVTVPRMKLIEGFNETQHSQTAGDLGPAYNPLVPDGIPGEKDFAVRDLGLPAEVKVARLDRRAHLLSEVNRAAGSDGLRSPRPGMQAAYEKAFDLLHSAKVHAAFDLDAEPAALRDRYGRNGFGQTTLLARRLVETGVRFVTVNWPSYYAWDHHGPIEGGIRSTGGWLDAALATLLEDLDQRGMLARTLVLVMGEFGRTPKLNPAGGRDHWVGVMSVLMAGGGIRGGQVIGSSTNDGYPDDRPIHARDMVATAYTALGIDPDAPMETVIGRPIQVLPAAERVRELLR